MANEILRKRRKVNADAWNAFLQMRAQAAAAGAQELSLDDINEEIKAVRNGK